MPLVIHWREVLKVPLPPLGHKPRCGTICAAGFATCGAFSMVMCLPLPYVVFNAGAQRSHARAASACCRRFVSASHRVSSTRMSCVCPSQDSLGVYVLRMHAAKTVSDHSRMRAEARARASRRTARPEYRRRRAGRRPPTAVRRDARSGRPGSPVRATAALRGARDGTTGSGVSASSGARMWTSTAPQ